MRAQGILRAEESSPSPQGGKIPSLDSPNRRILFLEELSRSLAQPHLRRAGEAGPKEGAWHLWILLSWHHLAFRFW